MNKINKNFNFFLLILIFFLGGRESKKYIKYTYSQIIYSFLIYIIYFLDKNKFHHFADKCRSTRPPTKQKFETIPSLSLFICCSSF